MAPHTATGDKAGWDTGEIAQDESNEIIVNVEMETYYFCVYHPHMKASFEIE
ncbi:MULTISPECIES: hypothetical protein [Falsihalocynthiibacter]|uniref:hypothetical protein n=1 Tax=Falsihalocynthiibacter TaxID=2854182 RepID=UPI00300103CE